MQWESEEGVLDLGLLVVLFDELGRGDSSEGPPLAWGVAPLGVCLEARGSLYWGPVATGELGNALEIRPEAPRGPRPWVW